MKEKKELKIDKNIINSIIVGFVISLIIILIIQHFGKFPYITGVQLRWFDSPFGYRYEFLGDNVVTSYSTLKLNYLTKLNVYFKSAFENFQYILYLWIPLSIIFIIYKKYNIKFK